MQICSNEFLPFSKHSEICKKKQKMNQFIEIQFTITEICMYIPFLSTHQNLLYLRCQYTVEILDMGMNEINSFH